ncbi:MAG TPA: ethanolamine ammonia-lyase subunit EutC [Nocardia sp.]|uniref:ethanolamine ammonia-lyase subunit EutC n=1 Tax=Nocardia sp. TaxID=1821 RepID=UPI002B4B6FCE|nr:ethanolamine ammonia-lyase subunit EutC [Nocardia sp.]HLS76154.1 ethanolamine ammonia-lyase subunit EutC [Nocardia sp.]
MSADPWAGIRATTQARIGLRRSGYALSTREVLDFQAAHAAARDAVHLPLPVAEIVTGLERLGLGAVRHVTSRAADRAEYLRRPDLGRVPAALDGLEHTGADLGILVADGLSATAVTEHAVALVEAVIARNGGVLTLAPPVVATQARVALGDHIGAALGVRTMLTVIGERPGLSVANSLSIYLTHHPAPGRRDSERNCVSNIHPPEGQGYEAAARIALTLVAGARELGVSGVALKDNSSPHPELT